MSTILRTDNRFLMLDCKCYLQTPYSPESIRKTWTRCGTLQDAVEKSNYRELQPYFYPYQRYLFGHKPLTAFAITATLHRRSLPGVSHNTFSHCHMTDAMAHHGDGGGLNSGPTPSSFTGGEDRATASELQNEDQTE
jgi:hypothetical protein